MNNIFLGNLLALVMSFVLASSATAAEHKVKMLNTGEAGNMVFEPALVYVEVGDTVKFIATDMGHNAESVEGLIPQGATDFKGNIGEDITVTVDKEGVYVIQCMPHSIMAMVSVIVAGSPTNLTTIKESSVAYSAKFALNKDRLANILSKVK